jgi:hypothetical protein
MARWCLALCLALPVAGQGLNPDKEAAHVSEGAAARDDVTTESASVGMSVTVGNRTSGDDAAPVKVLEAGKGGELFGECQHFSRENVDSKEEPVVKVTGMVKVDIFLRNRCEGYHIYKHTVGKCDPKASTDALAVATPVEQENKDGVEYVAWLNNAQSYRISKCD